MPSFVFARGQIPAAAVGADDAPEVVAAPAPEVVPEPKPARTPTRAEPKAPRRRAHHPAGHERAGEFVADDPSTPENEAFVEHQDAEG